MGHVIDKVILDVLNSDEEYEVKEDGKTVAVVISADRYRYLRGKLDEYTDA